MRAFAPWMDFKHEMDRLFDRFPMGRLEFGPKWAPSLDLSETKEALVVKLEIPGMDPADIQISLQENLLGFGR